jgi:hypothetical protein
MEVPFPKDDLIITYSDFLLVRDHLKHHQFNSCVFRHLLILTNDLWNTEKRINRLSLLLAIKQYFLVAHSGSNGHLQLVITEQNFELSGDIKILLFDLFRKMFESSTRISINQLETARRLCNRTLNGIRLWPSAEQWLCDHVDLSEYILNRVLRYPVMSDVISTWASNNYVTGKYRSRRGELLSWIIDKDPYFEIDEQTMLNDFEYLNHTDKKAIRQYVDELDANDLIRRELSEYFPPRASPFFDPSEGFHPDGDMINLTSPELHLSRRFYTYSETRLDDLIPIPDFKYMREQFWSDMDKNRKMTMIWAIGYSRLPNEQKSILLKQYYCNDTYHSLLKVCKKNNNIDMMKWMLSQQ